MFHAFIWLSEKNKQEFLEGKKIIIVGPYCSKCWNWEFWTYFFTEINVFVITQRVKYRKKVPLGTGTEFQVPYRFKCERYPTLKHMQMDNCFVISRCFFSILHHKCHVLRHCVKLKILQLWKMHVFCSTPSSCNVRTQSVWLWATPSALRRCGLMESESISYHS